MMDVLIRAMNAFFWGFGVWMTLSTLLALLVILLREPRR